MSTPVNPLHPDILPRLDEEYISFYNEHLANTLGVYQRPWTPSIRDEPPQPGGSDPIPVGSIRDVQLTSCRARVFTPEGDAPPAGWPVIVYFHGGGWVLGSINTENAFATNLCSRSKVVVFSVDYRLAPENPYPAAVHDAWDALLWVHTNGAKELGVDISRIAIGGSSSGGNLASIIAHKAVQASPPISLIFQMLIVPVIDNTASPDSSPDNQYPSWVENKYTPSLVPEKMLWFRKQYLPNEADRTKWDASPIFAPEDSFKKVPNAWIGVCELDLLRDEGIRYGEVLRKFGKEVEIKVYEKSPHPIMANDKYVSKGRQLISDACEALSKAAYPSQ
jgi:acetyl esterase/lipase